MKKLVLLLASLFLLGSCEGDVTFKPSEGGTYDPIADEVSLIENQRRVVSLTDIVAPATVKIGGTLALEDVSLVANYNDETHENVHPEEIQLSTSRLGVETGVVVYGGKTATFTITVVDDAEPGNEKTVASLGAVTFPDIHVGDQVSVNNVTVVVNYSDNTSETVHPTSILIDTSEPGVVNVKVSYGGTEVTTTATVLGEGEAPVKTLTSVEISSVPLQIAQDGTLANNQVTLVAHYSDGTSENVNPNSITLDTSAPGESVQGTASYGGLSASFTIEVLSSGVEPATITGIVVSSSPNSVEIGDTVTTDDVLITVSYSNNDVQIIHPSTVNVDTSDAGTVTGTVTYDVFDATFTLTVVDPDEEEDELMCTYRIYFDYSHTTIYNPTTKKDVDSPLLEFTAPMLRALGHAPEAIRQDGDPNKVDSTKVATLGTSMGFSADPAFPNFVGFSTHGVCLSADDLWDFTTDFRQQAVVALYGIWEAND